MTNNQAQGAKQENHSPLDFVIAKWEHECCGHAFLRVEDRYGGRTAPTRDQCDCRCHEKDVKEARRQLLDSAPKLYAALRDLYVFACQLSDCIGEFGGVQEGWAAIGERLAYLDECLEAVKTVLDDAVGQVQP